MFESIQSYFSSIPSLHRALILAGGITFFWLVESALPLFKFQYSKWRHASINIFFTLTTIVINFGFAFLMVKTSDWTIANNFGLLNAVLNSFHCLRIAMIIRAKGTDQAIRWANISTGLASCVSLK